MSTQIHAAPVTEPNITPMIDVLLVMIIVFNNTNLPSTELLAQLTRVYNGRPDKVIQIGGHAGVRYDDVMRAMDIAKKAGVRVIGVVPKATGER
jgi:biopolymer transport protein ExbD